MTSEELKRIANSGSYGSGKAARDRLAAEAEIREMLPHPLQVPVMVASPGSDMVPMAHFGNSGDDGKDWGLYHDGHESDIWCFGEDASTDAKIVAAILNAYRMGIIRRSPQ